MNKKVLLLPAAAACIAVAFAGKNDPVIMTVGDIQVPRSEFEYLYKKNAQQQLGNQSIDEYAELFKLYKMKVADALSEKLDTTSAFQNEFRGYRTELASPYLTDSVYIYELMHEAYDRAATEVDAIHIMRFKKPDNDANKQAVAQLDSIRDVIVNQGGDFALLAEQFSEDKGSSDKGGDMGYITSMQYPYDFETAAYTLNEGEISQIVESPQGYHLLKGGKKRPARGQVLAEHILLLVPQDASSEMAARIENQIDSIYNVAVAGGDFEELAKAYSQDPGSAGKGGLLPWFGAGRMVPEFENVAYETAVGEISKPFRTNYGWHIIKKLDARGRESFEEMKPALLQAVTRQGDTRQALISEHFFNKLCKKYNYKEYPEVDNQIIEYAGTNGIDSVFFAKFLETPEYANQTLISFDGGTRTLGDFLKSIVKYNNTKNPEAAQKFLEVRLLGWKNLQLCRQEEDDLDRQYPEFHNLVNEYHDGMLLFEVSNRKVWEKAASDTEGLTKFYDANRNRYRWNQPHVKGFLIQTVSPEMSDSISKALETVEPSEIGKYVIENFSNDAKAERVLAKKGDNALVDGLVFGAERKNPTNSKFKDCFMYGYRIIEQPEEMNDVRGQVTSDYQNELEKEWIESLRAKYPVKINDKEFKKMKQDLSKQPSK